MTHKVERIDNLMYRGCEPHWKCVNCGVCVPFHCYSKKSIEQMDCKGLDCSWGDDEKEVTK